VVYLIGLWMLVGGSSPTGLEMTHFLESDHGNHRFGTCAYSLDIETSYHGHFTLEIVLACCTGSERPDHAYPTF
jgi:hypothetical protein